MLYEESKWKIGSNCLCSECEVIKLKCLVLRGKANLETEFKLFKQSQYSRYESLYRFEAPIARREGVNTMVDRCQARRYSSFIRTILFFSNNYFKTNEHVSFFSLALYHQLQVSSD